MAPIDIPKKFKKLNHKKRFYIVKSIKRKRSKNKSSWKKHASLNNKERTFAYTNVLESYNIAEINKNSKIVQNNDRNRNFTQSCYSKQEQNHQKIFNSSRSKCNPSLSTSGTLKPAQSMKGFALKDLQIVFQDLNLVSDEKAQNLMNSAKIYDSNSHNSKIENNDEINKKNSNKYYLNPVVKLHNLFHLPMKEFCQTVKGFKVHFHGLFMKLMKQFFDLKILSRTYCEMSALINSKEMNTLVNSKTLHSGNVRKNIRKQKPKRIKSVKPTSKSLKQNGNILSTSFNVDKNLSLTELSNQNQQCDNTNNDIDIIKVEVILQSKNSEYNNKDEIIINPKASNFNTECTVQQKPDVNNKPSEHMQSHVINNQNILSVNIKKSNSNEVATLNKCSALVNANADVMMQPQLFNCENKLVTHLSISEIPNHYLDRKESIDNILNRHICTMYNSLKLNTLYEDQSQSKQIINKIEKNDLILNTKCQDIKDILYLNDTKNQMINLKSLWTLQVILQTKYQTSSSNPKFVICMHNNQVHNLIDKPTFQDLIHSKFFTLGIFLPSLSSCHGVKIAQKILHKECCLLLLHHSIIHDQFFSLFLSNVIKKNKISDDKKTIIYLPYTTFQVWTNITYDEKCSSRLFTQNFGLLSRELENQQNVLLLKCNIERYSDISTLKNALKTLHRKLQFEFQSAAVLLGNELDKFASQDEFYKVETIDTFLNK